MQTAYMVKVSIIAGDVIYDGEYSGIVHKDRESARKEMLKAKRETRNDANIDYVYLEEV